MMASPITLKVAMFRPVNMAATVKSNTIGVRMRVLSQKYSGKFYLKKDFGRSEMSSTMTLGDRVGPKSLKRSHVFPQQCLGFVYVRGTSSSDITDSEARITEFESLARVLNVLSVLLIFSGV